MRTAVIAMAALVAGVTVWGYVPALGRSTPRPDLDAFFDPGIPHGVPALVRSARGLYVRIRLDRPVALGFASTYSERLRERGMEPRPWGDSPHRPFPRLRGYHQYLVRELSRRPYVIEHRDVSIPGAGWPISLRYPWLLCRVGNGIDVPKEALLVPEHDVADITVPPDWRYPGAVIADVHSMEQSSSTVTIDFVAPAPAESVRAWARQVHARGWSVRELDNTLHVDPVAPVAGEPKSLIFETEFMLYWHNFPVYSRRRAAEFRSGFPEQTWVQQPALLSNLPDVSRYRVFAWFEDPLRARLAYARITGGRPVPPPSWITAR